MHLNLKFDLSLSWQLRWRASVFCTFEALLQYQCRRGALNAISFSLPLKILN